MTIIGFCRKYESSFLQAFKTTGDGSQDDGEDDHDATDPRCVDESDRVGDKSADRRTEGDPDIESGDVQRGRDIDRCRDIFFSELNDIELESRDIHERKQSHQDDAEDAGDFKRNHERHRNHDDRVDDEHIEQRFDRVAVGEFSTDGVADRDRDSVDEQDDADQARTDFRHVLHDRRQVGEGDERSTVPEGGDQETEH